MKIEILAPAGGRESLISALYTGADAVYLGYSSFSARKGAENFDENGLKEAAKLCHSHGAKMYVALNTLIKESELPKMRRAVAIAAEAGADGLIVQDLAVVKAARDIAPGLKLHASTQMTITSASGAEFAKKQGFSRVVLARELSFREIENIVKNVDIETEVFVHGALCVCVSGQCFFSAMLGGRSANRGACAQPCRLNFTCGERENVLSLKDLSILDRLKELEEVGVTSAKIEGRMKRSEYVAASVSQCIRALHGEKPDMKLLRDVFSRSGFTDGYYTGRMKEMQGIREKEDVIAAGGVMAELRSLYRTPVKRFTVDFYVEIYLGKPSACKAKCIFDGKEYSVRVEGKTPEQAENKPLTKERVIESMSRLGGTVFDIGRIECDLDDNAVLPMAELNGLRRKVLEKLLDKMSGYDNRGQ